MKNKNYGITLIALVITMIILLILAGVSISALTGKNNLFENAKKASIENNRSNIREFLDLKLLEEKTDKYEIEDKRIIIEATRENVIKNQNDLKKFGKIIEVREVLEEEQTDNIKKYFFYVIVDGEFYEVSIDGTKYVGKKSYNDVTLEEGDIKYTYTPTTDTNKNVKVKIETNKNIEGYKLLYKTDYQNDWRYYKEELEIDKNQNIYSKLEGISGQTTIATGTVANIDKLEPNDFTPEITSTTNTITVTASTTDKEKTNDYKCSGIEGYRFSKDNGTSWTDYQESGTYKFENLTQSTTYSIKVEAKDKAGNTKQSTTITKDTGTVPGIQTGSVVFTYDPTTDTSGNVKIKISGNNTGYILQYKTSKTGSSGETKDWTNYSNEITLTRNQDIYARVVDSTGQSASTYATGSIANIDKIKPNDFTPTATNTTKSITATASTTDKEKTDDYKCSGIYGYRFSKDNGSTWTSYQTSGTYTFNGLTQNTTYNIKVEAKDKAGNTTQGSINKATGKVPSSISIGYSTQSWTNGNVVVTASSNVSGYTLQYNNGNGWATYPSSGITRTSNGNVYFRLWDGVNAGDTATATVGNIDKSTPSNPGLSVTSGTGGNNGYYRSNVNVKITAGSDSISGVYKTTYTLSGAMSKGETTISSGGQITITSDGNTTITAYSYDRANNRSSAQITIKKDSTPPSLTATSFSQDATSASVSLQASDNIGIQYIQTSGNNNNTVNATTYTMKVSNDGTTTIKAVDLAGNTTTKTHNIKFLFKQNDQRTGVTGGWSQNYFRGLYGDIQNLTYWIRNGLLGITATSASVAQGRLGTWYTNNAINLSGYDTLRSLSWNSTSSSGASIEMRLQGNTVASKGNIPASHWVDLQYNISGINDSRQVMVGTNGGQYDNIDMYITIIYMYSFK